MVHERAFRYVQPSKSGVHLYVPPAAKAMLSDPSIPLGIVEGEKKALKATQEGLPYVAIGGVWNWRTDGRLLADFDQIALSGRLITYYPDSDVWERQVLLQAVYRLGAALEQRKAAVRVV
jgi:putative DNA primase/helicase